MEERANTMVCSMCGNVRSLVPVMGDDNKTYYFCDECVDKAIAIGARIMLQYKRNGTSYLEVNRHD